MKRNIPIYILTLCLLMVSGRSYAEIPLASSSAAQSDAAPKAKQDAKIEADVIKLRHKCEVKIANATKNGRTSVEILDKWYFLPFVPIHLYRKEAEDQVIQELKQKGYTAKSMKEAGFLYISWK